MGNERRHKRYSLNVVEVSGKMISATSVKIIDISTGGIALSADRRLNIGSDYALRIEARNKELSLKGVVMWSALSEAKRGSKGETIPVYTAGMQLIDMTPAQISALQRFIEEHKTEEKRLPSGRRLNVRFHIIVPEKIILQFPENYKVREISLSGMRIESDHELEIESRIPMELSLHDDEPITFKGRVASCQVKDDDSRKHHIGIEFLELTGKGREILSAFVVHCAAVEEGKIGKNKPRGENTSPEFIDKVEYLYKWHKTMGYYDALGIKRHANSEQIRSAFLARAEELDPGKLPNISDDVRSKVTAIFTYLSEAYSTLIEPGKRADYDRSTISRIRH